MTQAIEQMPGSISSLINPEPWGEQHLLPQKVFAQPFRLALKKNDVVTWIEVRSLAGLRNVTEKLTTGELTEIDRFSSLELQLWGHLAEHTGFLRVKGSTSALAAGIQPLGEEAVALAEDLSAIMGGDDVEALGTLGDMQDMLSRRPIDNTPMEQQPVTHEFIKPDGVNLTEKGEDALHELVMGNRSVNQPDRVSHHDVVAFEKRRENAIEIFLAQTPAATPEEIEAEKQEAIEAAALGELKVKPLGRLLAVISSESCDQTGQLIADMARARDNPDDTAVQMIAQRALAIMGVGPDGEPTDVTSPGSRQSDIPEVPQSSVQAFVNHFGVSVEELIRLATATRGPRPQPRFAEIAAQIKDTYVKKDVERVEPKSMEDQWNDELKRLREEDETRKSKPDNDQQ
jgi:hypothetical protein